MAGRCSPGLRAASCCSPASPPSCCERARGCRSASFFAASSLLIAVLAVVLAGKGVAALQEAGWVHATPLAIPRVDALGVEPTWQTLLAQLAVVAIVLVAYFANTRPERRLAPPG